MNKKTFAYIDESGNADLETTKEGASKYFIISSILVSQEKRNDLEKKIEKIRSKYFQTGEMKSSSVGKNNNRRSKILTAINELDFKFYALCVEKERIYKDSGLKYKPSFFKFVNGKLYSLLFTSYLDIHIVADEHGSLEFKNSFKNYIDKHHKPDIFYKSSFEIVNSKDEILVQLSDFIVGTIARIYENKGSAQLKEEYIKLISQKALSIDEWPTRYQAYFPKDVTTEEYSHLIYKYSLAQADLFIEENEKSIDEELLMQVAVLRHLVFHSRFIDKNSYVTTPKLIEYLKEAGHGEISKYVLRSKIIAPLRDSDVIVTSSNKGYKIPCSFLDMEEFVDRVNSIVKPLLSRLGRARKNLNIASSGELEILKGANYPHLVDFLKSLEKHRKAKI